MSSRPEPRLLLPLLAAAVAWSCSQPPPPPPPRDPPQVFITSPENNVVGTRIRLKITVNGCDQVQNLSLYDRDAFVKGVPFTGNPTEIELSPGDLGSLYSTLGIAPDLSLLAKATCDDGRTNKSQPEPIKFFPVRSVLDPPGGALAAPDSFVAEGGSGGLPVTLIGCAGQPNGTRALVRVDTQGNVVAANSGLPFPCSFSSTITERSTSSGKRWLWQYEVGAFAFDRNLNITAVVTGKVKALTILPDGDAVLWETGALGVTRVAHDSGGQRWRYPPGGLLITDPVAKPNINQVSYAQFIDDFGQYRGIVSVQSLDLTTGMPTSRYDLRLIGYGLLDPMPIPPAAFSDDAQILFFAVQTATDQFLVLACATNANSCDGGALRWQSPPLYGDALALVVSSSSTQVAAVSAQHTWFLSAGNGKVLNFGGRAINPDGALVTLGFQQGIGKDVYLLNGPPGGFPQEIVALDRPEDGEVYRYQMNAPSLSIAIDDSGKAWMRIGLKLVEPLPLSEYRLARGPAKP